MNYKDLSQFRLLDTFKSSSYEEEEENEYDQNKWIELIEKLSVTFENDMFDDEVLNKIVKYLISHSCDDALEILIKSDIPSFLFKYTIDFVKNKIIIGNITRKYKNKISINKKLCKILYLINEMLKAHDLFNYNTITEEIIDSFFDIYEFSESISSDFSISIITRYAEHSQENLLLLISDFDFKNRIMKKLMKSQRIPSVYAFFPFLKDEDTYHNADPKDIAIIEFLEGIQERHKENYEILLPILQFYELYMNYSEKCLEKVVRFQVIEMIMSALKTNNHIDKEILLELKQTAVDMILFVLNSQIDYCKYKIIDEYEENILKTIGILLSHENEYDNLSACQILFSLIQNEYITFSEGNNYLISQLLRIFKNSSFNLKYYVIKIFLVIVKSGDESIISTFGQDEVFDDIIDLIEFIDDESKIFVMDALYFSFQNYELCLSFVDQDEAINVFRNLNEKSLDERVLELSSLLAELLEMYCNK